MAMQGSSSSGAQPTRLQSQNFRPKSEWKHEEAASFLFIYLPGFAAEQLTITADYSNRMVYVQGQRRLPNNRMLSLNEAFTIPEEFDLGKMDKQFGRGLVMLKMPRKQPPKDQTTETSSQPQQTVIADDSMPRNQDESSISPSKETSAMTITEAEKSTAVGVVKSDGKEVAVETKEEKDGNGKPSDADKADQNVVQNAGVKEEISKESAAMANSTMAADAVEEKEKDKSLKWADQSVNTNEEQIRNENVNQSIVNELNENKRLMVNMGAAVLIIVGLGVSLFYKLRS